MKRSFPAILLFCSLPLLLLPACNKQKTLNIRLTIRDFHTGEPIAAGVRLYYQENPVQGSAVADMALGKADASGKFSYKSYIGKKYKLQLRIYGGEAYTHVMSVDGCSATQSTSTGSKNTYTIELKRQYRYLVTMTNQNCFDETDSVWVINNRLPSNYRFFHAGCGSHTSYIGNPMNGVQQNCSWSDDNPEQLFHVRVKRNGVITEFDQAILLQDGVVTPVNIQY